jgi:hypothetical protein
MILKITSKLSMQTCAQQMRLLTRKAGGQGTGMRQKPSFLANISAVFTTIFPSFILTLGKNVPSNS